MAFKKPKPKKPVRPSVRVPVARQVSEPITGDLAPAKPKPPRAPVVELPPQVPTARAAGDPAPPSVVEPTESGGVPIPLTDPSGEKVFAQTPVHRAACDPPSRT